MKCNKITLKLVSISQLNLTNVLEHHNVGVLICIFQYVNVRYLVLNFLNPCNLLVPFSVDSNKMQTIKDKFSLDRS